MNGSDALFKANKHEKDKLNPVYFYGGRRQACLQLKERIFKPKSFNLAQVEAFSGDLNKEFDQETKIVHTMIYDKNYEEIVIVCKVKDCPLRLPFALSQTGSSFYSLLKDSEIRHSLLAHSKPTI